MIALQILAACLLALSAAFFFVPQLVVYGPRSVPRLLRNRQARFMAGFLATSATCLVLAPNFGSALVEGGQTLTFVAVEIYNMSFGVV